MTNKHVSKSSSSMAPPTFKFPERATYLYTIIRPFAAIGLKVFFKKVYLSGLHHIPKDKPVILAANHPSAFLEPCILACFLDRPLFFLVRGDFFKKPFYATLLRSLHMLPVFRLKDGGYKKLKNNFATFQSCFDALKQDKTIMILAEGGTMHEKRLRPLRKGTGRIALGALDEYPELGDIAVIPVGVNYTYMERARSTVMIDFGESISAKAYWNGKETNEGIQALTKALRASLEERIVIIEDPLDDELAEQLLLVLRNDREQIDLPIIDESRDELVAEKEITDRLNGLSARAKEQVRQAGNAYFQALERHKLSDAGFLAAKKGNKFLSLFLFALGAIPAFLGYALHYLPLQLAKEAASKTKSIEFYSPVWWATGSMFGLIYYTLALLIGLSLNSRLYYSLLVLMPLTGYFALRYHDAWQVFKTQREADLLTKAELAELRQLRDQFKSSFSAAS